jgi:hypothetical protein
MTTSRHPWIQHLLSRPCPLCGGGEYSYFPQVGFEQVAGSSTHHFEVVVCRGCRKTEMFIKRVEELERLNAHAVVRLGDRAPYRG